MSTCCPYLFAIHFSFQDNRRSNHQCNQLHSLADSLSLNLHLSLHNNHHHVHPNSLSHILACDLVVNQRADQRHLRVNHLDVHLVDHRVIRPANPPQDPPNPEYLLRLMHLLRPTLQQVTPFHPPLTLTHSSDHFFASTQLSRLSSFIAGKEKMNTKKQRTGPDPRKSH